MDTQQSHRRLPTIQFRVLIIGRANAGKTSILQRVCDTTDSPVIYQGKTKVELNPSMDRGEHTIDDELVFSNHKGYVFHDSRGIESGSTEELEILRGFIRRKCGERRLGDRLHAIWYCVPMDNQRPGLDLKFYKDICPDQNVPVVVLFTKHDQFFRNVQIHLSDYPNEYPDSNISEVAEKLFQEHYMRPLGNDITFVCLKKMHIQNARCDELIEKTAAVLNQDIIALMLLAVQRDNLRLSVKAALDRAYPCTGSKVEDVIWYCLFPFPYIWLLELLLLEELEARESELFLEEELLEELSRRFFSREGFDFIKQVMSLSSIQNLASNIFGHHHLILAVILILKHATFLRLSDLPSRSALALADLHYQEANIDLKIHEFLTTSQEQSVILFVGFIMATDIESIHQGS